MCVEAINKERGLALLKDGSVTPFLEILDKKGDLTDDKSKAHFAVIMVKNIACYIIDFDDYNELSLN